MATKCLLLNWMRRALDRHGVRMFCTTYRRAACCTCQRPHRASVCSLARLWLRTQALRWWLASAMTSSCVGMRSEIGTQLTRIGLQASRNAQPSRSLHVSQKKERSHRALFLRLQHVRTWRGSALLALPRWADKALVDHFNAPAARGVSRSYSTVTLLARLRGLSTSVPRATAVWYASSCSGTACRMGLSAP